MDTISLASALHEALQNAPVKQETKTVMLSEALGKVLAQNLTVKKNLPSFDNSAMDGFAYAHTDAGKRVKVHSTIFAGDKPVASLKEGECYRIMTGAQVPHDADTIAPIEKCADVTQTEVTLPHDIPKGANLRKKGEETTVGKILFEKGTLLGSSEIALLASQGITAVRVVLPLKIAVVSSGNEIKEPWEEANEDQIYNANAFGITSLLRSFGFDAVYVGAIPDDYDSTVSFLSSIKSYDVILTTGGISHGDADYLYEAFVQNGLRPLFHGIRVKPGHPTMMGVMRDIFVMGMPGNPLTTMVMTHTLSVPVLFRMQGAKRVHHTPLLAKLTQTLHFRGKRTHIVLGKVENGNFTPTRGGKVGSGMLTPLCESNALAYFDENTQQADADTLIKVLLLDDKTRSDAFSLMN